MIWLSAPILARQARPRTAQTLARVSNAAFALAAMFPLLLVASLFAIAAMTGSVTPARAEAAPSCGGENVMAAIKKAEPELYAAIASEAAKTPYGDAILFKVESPDGTTAPNYLFGTMHLTDSRVTALPDQAASALKGAQTVAIETTDVLDEQKAALALMSRPDLTTFDGDKRLSDFLEADEKKLVDEMLAREGMQMALVEKMKPWLISSMLALPDCEADRKKSGVEILDVALAREAKETGKTLVGLETMIEQLDAMNSIPDEVHVRGLVDTLRIVDEMDDVIETMISLYTEGRVGEIWPFMRSYSEQLTAGYVTEEALAEAEAGYVAFEEAMITVRNRTMLERALPLLEKGGTFIAVGALHLPGENGLAQLFAEAGYQVTPVRN